MYYIDNNNTLKYVRNVKVGRYTEEDALSRTSLFKTPHNIHTKDDIHPNTKLYKCQEVNRYFK